MDEQLLSERERAALKAWSKSRQAGALGPEQLADWLAGRADEAVAATVEQALAADADLRAALAAVRAGETDAATEAELAMALAAFPAGQRLRPMPPLRWMRPMAAAAVVAGAVGFGWILGLAMGSQLLHNAAASAADLFGNSAAL
ncbi:MAG TPA: hypothetical protein VGM47_02745 [Gammaproteobacteria bacterium]|jgi:hypothetical protein